MGYLARTGDLSDGEPAPRRRVRLGDGLVRRREVLRSSGCSRSRAADIAARVARVPAARRVRGGAARVSDERPLDYAAAGVDIDARRRREAAHRARSSSRRSPRARAARSAASAACSACRRRAQRPVLVVERRRRRHEDQGRDRGGPARHGRPRPREPLRQRHPRAGRACRCSSSTTSRSARSSRRWSRRSSRASPRAAARTAARWSAARRPRCRASTRRRITTSRASSSAAWRRTRILGAERVRGRRRAHRAREQRAAHQRLLARAADRRRAA